MTHSLPGNGPDSIDTVLKYRWEVSSAVCRSLTNGLKDKTEPRQL